MLSCLLSWYIITLHKELVLELNKDLPERYKLYFLYTGKNTMYLLKKILFLSAFVFVFGWSLLKNDPQLNPLLVPTIKHDRLEFSPDFIGYDLPVTEMGLNDLWRNGPIPNPLKEIPTEIPYQQSDKDLTRTFASDQLGGGVITLFVDDSLPVEYHQYIYDLFQTIYLIAVEIYGTPAYTRTVTVRHNPGGISSAGTDTIYMSFLPNIALPYDSSNQIDPSFDHTFLHELLHIFHQPIYPVRPGGGWVEEGMTEAGTQLISNYLTEQNIRSILISNDLQLYDLRDRMGLGILSGSVSVLDGMTYAQSADLWWLLSSSESTGITGSWMDYDFLKRVNNKLMLDPNPTTEEFISIIDSESPYQIDGVTAGKWLLQQAIGRKFYTDGVFLGVYLTPSATRPNSVLNIQARAVEWSLGLRNTDVSGDINFTVTDVNGTPVASGSVTLSKGKGLTWISVGNWAPGGQK